MQNYWVGGESCNPPLYSVSSLGLHSESIFRWLKPLLYTEAFCICIYDIYTVLFRFNTQDYCLLDVPGVPKKANIATLVCSFMGSVGLGNILKIYLPMNFQKNALDTITSPAMKLQIPLVPVKQSITTSMKLFMKVMTTSRQYNQISNRTFMYNTSHLPCNCLFSNILIHFIQQQ